jgi:Uma2 family endonuclease
MTTLSTSDPLSEVIYPETDGQPMAENTLQFEWIVKIQGGLDSLFVDNPDVLVVGDLFWYPVQGQPGIRSAPDVMVVFGRPKGHRRSYLQWKEDNVAPQVVFEVLYPSNRPGEMQEKFDFFEQYGVQEYYLYDPDNPEIKGWQRTDSKLVPIPTVQNWVSPRLNIRFDMSSGHLVIYRPDGEPFATYLQVIAQRDQAEQAALDAQEAQRKAEDAAAEAQKAQREADERADKADDRAEKLAAKLRALGMDPDA